MIYTSTNQLQRSEVRDTSQYLGCMKIWNLNRACVFSPHHLKEYREWGVGSQLCHSYACVSTRTWVRAPPQCENRVMVICDCNPSVLGIRDRQSPVLPNQSASLTLQAWWETSQNKVDGSWGVTLEVNLWLLRACPQWHVHICARHITGVESKVLGEPRIYNVLSVIPPKDFEYASQWVPQLVTILGHI